MTQEIQTIRGVTKNYGTRETEMQFGGRVYGENLTKVATWTFDYDNLPVGGLSNLEHVIQAGSTIVSAKFRIITAFTSTSTTTDLTIGLQGSAAEVIDLDGLLTAAHLDQTTIQVVGALYDGAAGTAGALIGFISHASTDGELVVQSSAADLLTGRGEVIVEYMTPAALPA